jgi:uncharacterized protein GlcG (DUF336 family)
MNRITIELLEPRRLLSAATTANDAAAIAALPPPTITDGGDALTPPAPIPVPSEDVVLTTADVQKILAQALSQSVTASPGKPNTEAAVVVDREGNVLGALASASTVGGTDPIAPQILLEAELRARTSAFFESEGEAFTTRTARFIIQNHFPAGVANSGGGPLYGVEFSDLVGSDILPASLTPAISGDPGGIPLYIDGIPVGAIGVAGDYKDTAADPQLIPVTQDKTVSLDENQYNANPKGLVYTGGEETDRDEAVAQAGAQGFMAPPAIRGNNVFINGLRLPFVAEGPAHGQPFQTFQSLENYGAVEYVFEYSQSIFNIEPVPKGKTAIVAGQPEMENYVVPANGNIPAVPGLIRERSNLEQSDTPGVPLRTASGATIAYPDSQGQSNIIASNVAGGLTLSDVTTIIDQAIDQAMLTRAGIRKPNGANAEVHVVVTDLNGNVLGDFRMNDATNFSDDVAVQKARTAAFFSDDTHAFSSRAIGFMSQKFFPAGINGGVTGPLYLLQNNLDNPFIPAADPLALKQPTPPGLANGITIFPGGFPLYKNGKLVGAIGVSGDGVDQDDLISYTGATGYQAPAAIRSDSLSAPDITSFIVSKIQEIEQTTPLGYDAVGQATKSLNKALPKTRLPYAKFPRNPDV